MNPEACMFVLVMSLVSVCLGAAWLACSPTVGVVRLLRRRCVRRQQGGLAISLGLAVRQILRRDGMLAGLRDRLAWSQQKLEQLGLLKSRVLSVAAHEMRSPLAAVRGYAEILEGHDLEERDRRCIRGILIATETVSRLVGDLGDLAILEAGKLRLHLEPLRVADLLTEAVAQMAPVASKSGVSLDLAAAPPRAWIVADRFRLGQVLSNLLGNAVKFTPRGGRVGLQSARAGGGFEFSVSDTGPGIHPVEQKRIFEKFYQSPKMAARAGLRGWGLGLSVASEIVRAHQGRIGVESAGLGKGSRFWFFIPDKPQELGIDAREGMGRKAVGMISRGVPFATFGVLLALCWAGHIGALPAEEFAPPTLMDNSRELGERTLGKESHLSNGPSELEFAGRPAYARTALVAGAAGEEVEYERILEEKVEGLLARILGAGRARASVDVSLDFSAVERLEKRPGTASVSEAAPQDLLPGIPAEPVKVEAMAQIVERRFTRPASLVKRVIATIILDGGVPRSQVDKLQPIIEDVLEINPSRGDIVTIHYVPFLSPWANLWRSDWLRKDIARYGIFLIVGLMIVGVVALCLLRLAGAVRAVAQAPVGAEMPIPEFLRSPESRLSPPLSPVPADSAALPRGEPPMEITATLPHPSPEPSPQAVLVRPPRGDVESLLDMLRSEPPGHIALAAACLDPENRLELIMRLPDARRLEVLAYASITRFVDPDILAKIRTEMDRRLRGAVGGVADMASLLEAAAPEIQKKTIEELSASNPELGRRLRARFVWMEDLVRLEPAEWSLLINKTRIEDWAAALRGVSDELRAAVQGRVFPTTWEILLQLPDFSSPSQERIREAQAAVLHRARELLAEGRIRHPQSRLESVAGPAVGAIP